MLKSYGFFPKLRATGPKPEGITDAWGVKLKASSMVSRVSNLIPQPGGGRSRFALMMEQGL